MSTVQARIKRTTHTRFIRSKNAYARLFRLVYMCAYLPLLFIVVISLCVVLSNKTKEFTRLPTNTKFAFCETSQ